MEYLRVNDEFDLLDDGLEPGEIKKLAILKHKVRWSLDASHDGRTRMFGEMLNRGLKRHTLLGALVTETGYLIDSGIYKFWPAKSEL